MTTTSTHPVIFMDDPGKVIIAVSFFVTVAFSISAIVRGSLAMRKQSRQPDQEANSPGDQRLARLEQAVDAIALEIERISEGQRFTTRLLSEQSRRASEPAARRLSSNTPV
ncbi:MAG TPA: hypothetical protein VLJ83_07325 [Gemmatimonadaceae bacterium]|nr:hypothetical protein [Gemmatimonadaceae bacterium]